MTSVLEDSKADTEAIARLAKLAKLKAEMVALEAMTK
jgi:hypothetical protein